jgi:NAD-dependent deacetylase
MRSEDARRRYWAVGKELYAAIRRAEPNPAHRAIVTLERLGLLDCVITQNVDDLHQRAGTDPARVIELHGNATRVRCLACGRRSTRDEIQERLLAGEAVPACRACGGIVKPLTVLFGEPMPAAAVEEAEARSRAAGCFLVVGSSLAVYPAAYMPTYAREGGARLVVVNLTPTRLDHLADVVLAGPAGSILAGLAGRIEARVAR